MDLSAAVPFVCTIARTRPRRGRTRDYRVSNKESNPRTAGGGGRGSNRWDLIPSIPRDASKENEKKKKKKKKEGNTRKTARVHESCMPADSASLSEKCSADVRVPAGLPLQGKASSPRCVLAPIAPLQMSRSRDSPDRSPARQPTSASSAIFNDVLPRDRKILPSSASRKFANEPRARN